MLQALMRRTWAPRGETPQHYAWDRHDRLSTIAALTLSPQRRRIGLYFQVYDHNIRTPETLAFVQQLHCQTGREMLVIWDRWRVHRSAASQLERFPWFHVEWLPAYAPDLNPVEALWSQTKYSELANLIPDDLSELEDALLDSLWDQHYDQRLKRSFFHAAQLDL
jgi:transposase